MELKNSEIRQAILGEHEQLRARMRELQAALEGAGATATAGVPPVLPGALHAFLQEFLKHIDHEEAILRPVLAHVDAWARHRVESMDSEHAEQRARLTALARMDPASDPRSFVSGVRETLEWIRQDMAGEEKTMLSPELLRDDIIVIDSFGG
jgi:iron-sulfur cluster repair protein YtfE (RIC family)